MAEKLTIQQKKDWAKLLFTKEGINTQKELAARVGVSEKTIGKWIKDEAWEKLRTSLIMTKEEELSRLYDQLSELNTWITSKPKGKRYADAKEADTLVKLSAAIRSLETDTSVSEVIQSATGFIKWLQTSDLTKAQEIAQLFDAYIKTLLK